MRTIVDLPDDQIEALKQLGRQQKLSRAALVRKAVEEYLRRHRPEGGDRAFGLWSRRGEDGLDYQARRRGEWDE